MTERTRSVYLYWGLITVCRTVNAEWKVVQFEFVFFKFAATTFPVLIMNSFTVQAIVRISENLGPKSEDNKGGSGRRQKKKHAFRAHSHLG